MLNSVNLVGRLTADPVKRETTAGNPVASFTIAVDRTGSKTKEADFINCVVWNGTADNVAKYTHKGMLVSVEGSLRSRKYTDKQGNNRTAVEVNVQSVQFLEAKQSSPGANTANQQDQYEGVSDSDLPF